MTKTERMRLLALALALGACDAPDAADRAPASEAESAEQSGSLFATVPDRQWRLPSQLREISGLAVAPDGRLFGHDDEVAVLYELDIENGGLAKAFALGDPVERGDFEGLAITPDGGFHLITSKGRLYSFAEGANGGHVAFDVTDIGLAEVCEIEGLTFSPAEDSLIVACKTNEARDMKDVVALYAWSPNEQTLRPWLTTAAAPLTEAIGERRFRPSAVELDAASGRVLLLSARGRALAELDREGALLAARQLGEIHVQAEGMAVLPGGALAIADEGQDGRALLSRYPRAAE